MPRPGVGNPGNKGGGRKCAWQEKKDGQWHVDVWNSLNNRRELEERIASGVYSGRDMALYMLLKGNERIVGKFMDKLVPDLHEVTGKDGGPLFLPVEIINKNGLHPDASPKADSPGQP